MKDLIKPRTIFAGLFYATFCYIVLVGNEVPKELVTIVATMSGFYFGQRAKKGGSDGVS